MKKVAPYLLFPALLGGAMAVAGVSVSRLEAARYPLALSGILLGAILVIAVAERIIPYRAEWNRGQGDTWSDLLHTVFSFSITAKVVEAAMWAAFLGTAAWLAQKVGKTGMGILPVEWPLPFQLGLSVMLAELGLYSIHRAAHEIPWLWRLHAVHHSAPRLYWLNAGRFHPLDVIVQSVPGMLPLVLLGAPADALFLHWTFTGVHGMLQHCNAEMRLGWLNKVFSSADLHRWHHSRKPAESDHNYGKVLALWDYVFRSRYLPEREVGPLGLENGGFPVSFLGHLAAPLAWKGFSEGGATKRAPAPSNP